MKKINTKKKKRKKINIHIHARVHLQVKDVIIQTFICHLKQLSLNSLKLEFI